jgi:formate/nitrite transporter FocA (FNT family)
MAGDLSEEKRDTDTDQSEPRKPARRILEHEISEGLGEIQRSTSGLFIAGLSAGLDLGFSIFLMAVMLSNAEGKLPQPIVEVLMAHMYTIGFIFVILGRSELFTEHTTLAVLPVLNGRASLGGLARLWAIIFFSNLIGASLFGALIAWIGPALGVVKPSAMGFLSHQMVAQGWWVILLSAVLAGWMMGLLSWLVAAGRDTISQIVFVWFVTSAIGFSHLHHAISGTTEVLMGLFAGQGITLADYGHFLLWTTIGNSLGGVFFVAVIKYSHVIRSSGEKEDVHLEDSPQKQR